MARFNPLSIITKFFKNVFTDKNDNLDADISHQERLEAYNLLWSYYINNVYTRTFFGGHLDYINQQLGEQASNQLYGLINPIEQVIELYAQNTFSGFYGKDFYIESEVNDGKNKKAVNSEILEPINNIMKWSNFNAHKDRFSRITALFGNCGIRVVVKVGADYPNDDITERRVYLQFEHPALIEDYVTDGRDNVTQILTKHQVVEGDLSFSSSEQRKSHTYRILMTKERFKTERDDKQFDLTGLNKPNNQTEKEQEISGSFADYANIYGFTPYAISFARKHDSKWGAWVFLGSEQIIDRNNALSAHIEKQITRHVNVTWMVTTTGDAPQEYNFSGSRVLVIKRQASMEGVNGDTKVEPLIATLDLSGAIEKLKFNVTQLADRLPELKAINGEFLSGQSGETIAQLRKPAEDKLLAFRGNAEATLIRAIQMALSAGIVLGIWNVGTGSGTREAMDKAYKTGLLDFEFNERPALTITKQEKLAVDLQEVEIDQSKQDLENSKHDFGQSQDLFSNNNKQPQQTNNIVNDKTN